MRQKLENKVFAASDFLDKKFGLMVI